MAFEDLITSIAAFRLALLRVLIGAVAIVSQEEAHQINIPPADIIQEYVDEVVETDGLQAILGKRRHSFSLDSHGMPKKWKVMHYNRQRAYDCVMEDYLGPSPTFDDRQFERIFRIKRHMVDDLLGKLAQHDPFWTTTVDACGKPSIDPRVKFLAAQKMICYGVSFSAFHDYFQMGESTARLCMSKLCRHMIECEEISAFYLRYPTKSDARRIVQLHKHEHGIDGMLGSLDVTKIHWTNCPKAWHGQFKGKEGIPTIGLEAVIDYNLWFWHSAFGFPGSLNDLNIWDKSPLFASMMDGAHSEIDFPFTLDGQIFTKLYYLVDGIYPWLARFLRSVKDPTTFLDQYWAGLQEAWRKAVERGFGVYKKKFLSVGNRVTLHERDDIFYLVKATIVMHNMMVEARIERDEVESETFYEVPETNVPASASGSGGSDSRSTKNSNRTLEYDSNNGRDNIDKYRLVHRRWKDLYSTEEALRLNNAAKRHVYKAKFGDDGTLIDAENNFFDGYDPLSF